MSCVDIPCDGAPFAPGPFDPGILRVPVLSVLPDSQHLRVLREAQNHQLGIAALAVDPGELRSGDCGLPGRFAAPLQGVGLDHGTAPLCMWLCIIIVGGGELAWICERPSLDFIDLRDACVLALELGIVGCACVAQYAKKKPKKKPYAVRTPDRQNGVSSAVWPPTTAPMTVGQPFPTAPTQRGGRKGGRRHIKQLRKTRFVGRLFYGGDEKKIEDDTFTAPLGRGILLALLCKVALAHVRVEPAFRLAERFPGCISGLWASGGGEEE